MGSNGEDLENSLNELEKKMTSFSSILEKFGLDIITKMGQTNLKITQLTDMVEELHKSTIKIKGLTPQLTNVIENQKDIEDELDLIKSLIMNLTSLPLKKEEVKNAIERDESATNKKDLILNQLNALKTNLGSFNEPQAVKAVLKQIKEDIYEFTGGHRMLYEISQILTMLDSANSLQDVIDDKEQPSKSLEEHLGEKITFWANKLAVKD
jgi:DNA repair ATPase RecN